MQLRFICFLKYVIDRKFLLNYAGNVNVLMKTHFHFRNLGNTTLAIIETDLKYEI